MLEINAANEGEEPEVPYTCSAQHIRTMSQSWDDISETLVYPLTTLYKVQISCHRKIPPYKTGYLSSCTKVRRRHQRGLLNQILWTAQSHPSCRTAQKIKSSEPPWQVFTGQSQAVSTYWSSNPSRQWENQTHAYLRTIARSIMDGQHQQSVIPGSHSEARAEQMHKRQSDCSRPPQWSMGVAVYSTYIPVLFHAGSATRS